MQTEVAGSIAATNKQLNEVNARLGALCLAKQNQGETAADQACAISQVAVEQTALGESRKLLEELLSDIQITAANAQLGCAQLVNNFGSRNEGIQIGVSYGAISGITFGKK